MIRVRTGSRLHFGLFSLPSEQAGPWLNQEGLPTLPRRNFGGVGLMVDKPGIELTVKRARQWSAVGPLAERALKFAHRYCESVGITDCFRVQVLSAAPEHVGLGTGTQLGLAVARSIAGLTHQPWPEIWNTKLAKHVGRGRRSAIGVHGFQWPGFIVEAGNTSAEKISPLLFSRAFPEEWSTLLIIPEGITGEHGHDEVKAFAALAKKGSDDRSTEILCRLVLLGMLPAIDELDLDAFGEALYDFNRRSGEMFAQVQGGIYAHPRVEAIVKSLRALGVKGVGQSSWGPAIFAIVVAEQAEMIRDQLIGNGTIAPHEAVVAWGVNNPIKTRRR